MGDWKIFYCLYLSGIRLHAIFGKHGTVESYMGLSDAAYFTVEYEVILPCWFHEPDEVVIMFLGGVLPKVHMSSCIA